MLPNFYYNKDINQKLPNRTHVLKNALILVCYLIKLFIDKYLN